MSEVKPVDVKMIGEKFAKAFVKAQSQVKKAVKDKTNPHFKSKYADLADVADACNEALWSNGLAVMQRLSSKENKAVCRTTIIHESGECMDDGEGLELPVTKADAQGFGSAFTYARRYSLAAMCGVAPEDDDGNAAVGGNAAPSGVAGLKQKVAAPAQPAPAASPPKQRKLVAQDEPPHSADTGEVATHDRNMSMAFGRGKGQPIQSLDVKSLNWYRDALTRDLADESKAQWWDKTRKQLETLNAELGFRI